MLKYLPLFVALSASAQTLTFHPKEDATAILHNPDMGWVLYENYPIDPDPHGSSTLLTLPNESFDVADAVAVMFTWADVEKTPDAYDFSRVDYAYDYWAKRGKAIQLRMSTDTLLWWNTRNPPAGLGVPPYVVDKLPADKKQVRTSDGIPYNVVDAREPYYLNRLAKFLDAVEKHFDAKRPVCLIDLRGFGLWGEWHTGYKYATVEDRHAALSGVLDCWSKHLPDHFLALSFSYDPDSPKIYYSGPYKAFDAKFTAAYDAFVHFSAFDHALKLPNVVFRRDGVGGAVHSNERKLNELAFDLGKSPMMSEFMGGYADAKKGARGWVEWTVDDALSVHPNYVAFLGWQGGDALAFIRERPDLIEKGLRTMGYRLVPTTVELHGDPVSGAKLVAATTWVNRAVGRAAHDFQLVFRLKNSENEYVLPSEGVAARQWVRGTEHRALNHFDLKDVKPGEYRIDLGLIDPRDGKRIGLPLVDGDDCYYPLGQVRVR